MPRSIISELYSFRRVRITACRIVDDVLELDLLPDRRYTPICSCCGSRSGRIHSIRERRLRDLPAGGYQVYLNCQQRLLWCDDCRRIVVEDLELFDLYKRHTRRFARMVYDLCRIMTVQDVKNHLGLDWKTVKDIDRSFLEEDYMDPDYDDLRILAVDEISLRKGHKYMTVVVDHVRGRVIWIGCDRTSKTLHTFFDELSEEQKSSIEAVAMDMWQPYIGVVKRRLPAAEIVFDLFHVVSSFGRVIAHVRGLEYQKASEEDKDVLKGTTFMLLRNTENLSEGQREHLDKLLLLNSVLAKTLILKEKLKHIWDCDHWSTARARIMEWCSMARSIGYRVLDSFAGMLERHSYGILSHCRYPIHTGKIEGMNNKIKVIKRKAYGFRDHDYFALKIIQAFSD